MMVINGVKNQFFFNFNSKKNLIVLAQYIMIPVLALAVMPMLGLGFLGYRVTLKARGRSQLFTRSQNPFVKSLHLSPFREHIKKVLNVCLGGHT